MPLPDFLIAGERRCGTTSLYHWLSGHPAVRMYPRSDTSWFIDDGVKGKTWREGYVDPALWKKDHNVEAYAARFEPAEADTVTGEKCADLMYWQPSHERLRRFLPEAKFIIVLRNPVRRAWSHYCNEVGKGRETLSIREALAQEDTRASQSDFARYHLSYRRRGNYDDSLSRFLEYIPRENVMIVIHEKLIHDRQQELARIARFIGAEPAEAFPEEGKRHNTNWTMLRRDWVEPLHLTALDNAWHWMMQKLANLLFLGSRNRKARRRMFMFVAERPFRVPMRNTRLPDDIAAELAKYYAPHIETLEKLINEDLSVWKA